MIKIVKIFFLILFLGCSFATTEKNDEGNNNSFQNYWYQGKAELNRFELQQARYGEIRNGEAVMIFVTEDFLPDKQVKNEKYQSLNSTNVLKLNFIKKFITGIYDYSMMLSVFTPIEVKKYPSTFKTTMTSQDWCGHTFTQLNWRGSYYQVQEFSYFESEADEQKKVENVWLEDEIWNRIRMNPNSLPLGKIKLIPSSMQSRLRHVSLQTEIATAELKEMEIDKKTFYTYLINYEKSERNIKIIFEKDFPYAIDGWEESYKDGFGKNATMLTTKAKHTNSMMINYWDKNSNQDLFLRDSLGIKNKIEK